MRIENENEQQTAGGEAGAPAESQQQQPGEKQPEGGEQPAA